MKPLAIYIHIPFCVRKCAYCDFLSFPGTEEMQEQYIQKLLWEIRENASAYRGYEVKTVFIGGGTPTSIPAEQMVRVTETLQECYQIAADAECTIECNPGTADAVKLAAYRSCGINRISIGCQSVHDRELKLLGRIHNREQFLDCFHAARKAGFENVNVDLMSALPGQTVADWEENLRTLAELAPEHISAYSLIIEEGTPFYGRYHRQLELREKGLEPDEIRRKIQAENRADRTEQAISETELLPSEDAEREMYHRTAELLSEYGYRQYELSNYAKPDRECRHNMVYWKREDYAGFGLGAASCVKDVRWKNETGVERYLACEQAADLQTDREVLSPEEQRSEAMFLGLRLTEGVNIEEYVQRYGRAPEEEYGEQICKMKQERLLAERDGALRLTGTGRDLANVVMAGFI
ncbi:MAG: radical SAM family heme chaperone HemW [Lachnospiraceae bacterium]|nr:radical SAM family heme chaperone HemW [Lachnospiraceae bacterium]